LKYQTTAAWLASPDVTSSTAFSTSLSCGATMSDSPASSRDNFDRTSGSAIGRIQLFFNLDVTYGGDVHAAGKCDTYIDSILNLWNRVSAHQPLPSWN
jgi:hypothetical protein